MAAMHDMATPVTTRMHVQATAAAAAQRATPEGQKETEGLGMCVVGQVSVSSDGVLFATSGHHGHVAVWYTATFKLVRTLQGYCLGKHVYCNAWSPVGGLLATGSYDGTVTVWDVTTGAVHVSQQGHGNDVRSEAVTSVAWSPDGLKLCKGSRDQTARVWELATGSLLRVLDEAGYSVMKNSVARSPAGTCVATCTGENVHVWDAATGERVRELGDEYDAALIGLVAVSYTHLTLPTKA